MKKLTYENNLPPVLNQENLEKSTNLMQKKHIAFLDNEFFSIESGFSEDQIQLKVTLFKQDQSVFYPIEAIFVRSQEDILSPQESIFLMLDYLDLYWTEYFTEDRSVYLALNWTEHICEEQKFYLRGFIRNLSLESLADELLKKHGHGDYDIQSITLET